MRVIRIRKNWRQW
uniref:Truncated envelope glycoprotein n=1 Tax=Human immunodeficiency virus type 1 TaxID=11676 RepID=A0A0H3YCU0_HV1|nr:truncated envelope glycoprotein [Human immunodeficiency virus 1]